MSWSYGRMTFPISGDDNPNIDRTADQLEDLKSLELKLEERDASINKLNEELKEHQEKNLALTRFIEKRDEHIMSIRQQHQDSLDKKQERIKELEAILQSERRSVPIDYDQDLGALYVELGQKYVAAAREHVRVNKEYAKVLEELERYRGDLVHHHFSSLCNIIIEINYHLNYRNN
jgi:DNA repair exonuclease SbcCD ATPase subunit